MASQPALPPAAREGAGVAGGAEGKVRVSTAELALAETHLEGALTTTDTWGRIELRIKVKDDQAATANDQVWLYLQDNAGLWQLTQLAQMSVPDRFAGAGVVRRLLPVAHVRETVIVARSGSLAD
jgi:hypothetical protein